MQDAPAGASAAAPMEPDGIPAGYREDVPLSRELQEILLEACNMTGVDYAVALGLVEAQSGFNPAAVNPALGGYGLCQLNPTWFPVGLPPEDNVRVRMSYLADCIARYGGDLEKGLAAYNQGRYKGTVTDYAKRVIQASERWRHAKSER